MATTTRGVSAPGTSRGGGRWYTTRTTNLAARLALIAVLLGIWQLLVVGGALNKDAFPTMSSTLAALVDQIHTSACWTTVAQTLEGWGVGVALGCVAAIVLGSAIGLSRFAYRSTIPVIEFLKAVPVVAILPIAIVEFGTRLSMKMVLVAFGVFFPLVIQVIYGVRSVDPTVADTATSLQVRGARRFFVVVIPSAAPFIATGVRIAAATGLVIEIVAELIGGGAGLGQRILAAENAGPSSLPVMYAFILITGLIGVTLTGIFTVAERRTLRWHESQRNIVSRGAS